LAEQNLCFEDYRNFGSTKTIYAKTDSQTWTASSHQDVSLRSDDWNQIF